MNREDAAALRGLALRAVVHRVDDGAAEQRVDVETGAGVLRTDVEVLQPFGLAARPVAGGLTVVIAIGGDQGDLVALPIAGARLGGLAEGDAALHDEAGQRVHLRPADGLVVVHAAREVALRVGGVALRITESGAELLGDLRVEGNILATGAVHDGAGNVRS